MAFKVSFNWAKKCKGLNGGGKSKAPNVSVEAGAPKFTFGEKTSPAAQKTNFTFGEKRGQDALQAHTEAIGRQNRTIGNWGKKSAPTNPYYIMLSGNNPNIAGARTHFHKNTGAFLHCPTSSNLTGTEWGFENGLYNLEEWYKKGLIPDDIKYVLIGHGQGATASNNWVFAENNKSIFDYINKKIPPGEKAIVLCCETAYNSPAGKPGIGFPCLTTLLEPSGPAKIVESGKNEIIGHFFNPLAPNGGVTYY